MPRFQITREDWDVETGERTMLPIETLVVLETEEGPIEPVITGQESDAASLAAALSTQNNMDYAFVEISAEEGDGGSAEEPGAGEGAP